jgi:hypothetical protein
VQQRLLPLLGEAFEAQALSGKLCDAPTCTNVRGQTEASLLQPQYACSACGVASYCSDACRAADAARHAAACAAIQGLRA